jgi:Na+-driven multidrug efflux pump
MFAGVTLIVTVILDLMLIPKMGIQGAAIASSVAYTFNSLLVARVLKRKIGVRWRDLYIPTRADFAPYRQVWRRLLKLISWSPAY